MKMSVIAGKPHAQLCRTLCDPMDCSPPGSSVHEIFQAGILEAVTIFFSRRSSQPRDRTRTQTQSQVSCVSCKAEYPWPSINVVFCSCCYCFGSDLKFRLYTKVKIRKNFKGGDTSEDPEGVEHRCVSHGVVVNSKRRHQDPTAGSTGSQLLAVRSQAASTCQPYEMESFLP